MCMGMFFFFFFFFFFFQEGSGACQHPDTTCYETLKNVYLESNLMFSRARCKFLPSLDTVGLTDYEQYKL